MWRHFGGERHRVGPVRHRSVCTVHSELVQPVGGEARPEQLPDPRGAQYPHGGVIAVPAVELTDQVHPLGIRGPHREGHPVDHAIGGGETARMGAEDLPETFVAALGEQVQVHLAQSRQEPVAVGDGVRLIAAGIADLESVVHEVDERQLDRVHPGVNVGHRVARPADHDAHRGRMRTQCPDDGPGAVLVGTQDGVRVVVDPGEQSRQIRRIRRQTDGAHSRRSRGARCSGGIGGILRMWATARAGSSRTKFSRPH